MPFAVCPGCDEDISLRTAPKLGATVVCPSCGAELEVVSVKPLELDWPWEDEDDADEDDEEEEEDE